MSNVPSKVGMLGHGLVAEVVPGEDVGDQVGQVHLHGGLGDVERALEGTDLLDLGGILEIEAGEEVPGGDDRAGAEVVSDLSRLGGLDGYDHLHGLDLDVGLALLAGEIRSTRNVYLVSMYATSTLKDLIPGMSPVDTWPFRKDPLTALADGGK